MTERNEQATDGVADVHEPGRELEVLHRASLYLHRLRDPEVLAQNVITLLCEVVHHDFAAVYLVDGDRLSTFAVSDRGLGDSVVKSDKAYLDSLDLRVGKHVTGWVAKHGQSVLLNDVAEDDRYLDSQAEIASELCVPMWSNEQVIGVVNVESKRKHAYRPADQRVLEIAANQVAIAIENARLVGRIAEVERLKAQADLTGGIAHDLGNMLVAASLRCELLRRSDRLAPPEAEELAAIATVLDKTVMLTRSLMQFGVPQAEPAQWLDLGDHLHCTTPLIEALCGQRIRVHVEAERGRLFVYARLGQVDQILINLVVNAREAVGAHGNLWIRAARLGDGDAISEVQLEVQDDGCGMAPETLARAMQPLFTTRITGSGLGLPTVARLVEELGGRLALESTEHRGTRVRVTLPMQEQAEPADAVAGAPG